MNRVSHSKAPYDEWLKDMEADITLLTSDQQVEGFKGYKKVKTISNYDSSGLVEKKAIDLANENSYDTVIAISELDLIRAAKIREKFSIKGQKEESALAFRNKVIMKGIANKTSIKVPNYSKINSTFDLLDFITNNGYPVVVKPIDGSGSVNTNVLYNDIQLENFLSGGIHDNLMVEQFIEGDMYHIDGLVVKGKIMLIWPSKYINGCLAFKDGKYLGSYLLDNENPLTRELIKKVEELLKVFPTPETTTFHAEIFHTINNEFYFCEIASRTGGGPIKDVILQAFDIDITKLWVQAQCGIYIETPNQNGELLTPNIQTGFVLIPPEKGVFKGIQMGNLPEWVDDYKIFATEGQSFNHAKLSIDHIASFRVQGISEKDILSKIQFVTNLFQNSIRWE